jgi:hypothetical protein
MATVVADLEGASSREVKAPGRLAGGHSAPERVEPGWRDTGAEGAARPGVMRYRIALWASHARLAKP